MTGPQGPYQPMGQSFDWNRPPASNRRWSKRRIFTAVVGVAVIFGVIGSCIDSPSDKNAPDSVVGSDASTTSSSLPSAPVGYTFDELEAHAVLVGTVEEIAYGEISVGVLVNDDKTSETTLDFELALIGANKCYVMSEPMGKALVEVLPIGTAVTIVRTAEKASSTELGNEAFIHLPAPGKEASEIAYGSSVNELLVARGAASLMPELDRSPSAAAFPAQIDAIRMSVPLQSESYVAPIAAADMKAWDERIGMAGVCRANQEKAARELEESNRKYYGPDGVPGTDDDPNNNNYDVPDFVPGTGGGGGGGGICRRSRFC